MEGQKTLTYACMTLLLREKSENLYLSSKVKKVHFRWLTSQKFDASQWLCKISAIFPFFDVTKLFSCTWTIPDMVRKFAFLGSIFAQLRIVLFYYTCKFTLSWTENCLSAETWVDFLDKPLMDGREVHVLWRNLPFSKHWEGMVLSKNKHHLGLHINKADKPDWPLRP